MADDEIKGGRWLEAALVASGLTLFLLLFPSVWTGAVMVAGLTAGYIDVRGWTWRSYAVVSFITIVALVIAKARQDNAWNSR